MLENSYSPTRPLHALLDELLAIGITFLIIVLNHRTDIFFEKKAGLIKATTWNMEVKKAG